MEQYKTVELFNANAEMYWNIDKFIESQGFSNVVEYCAVLLEKLGSVAWCTQIVTDDMYHQSNRDLNWVYEETIQRLEKNYNLCIISCIGLWNGTYKGTLQDITTIDIPWGDVIKLEIKDKALEITTAHHDGRNTYKIYCVDSNSPTVEEFYNEKQNNDYYDYEYDVNLDNEKDIEEYIDIYCLSMYDLFYECKI